MVTVDRFTYHSDQPPAGYITVTTLDDGEQIVYGVFDDIKLAIQFGTNLVNANVKPIFRPALH
jgi:hypothetical protein